MSELKQLSANDITNISKVLLDLLRKCPSIPDGIKLKYQFLDENSGLSLHTLKGTVKKHEYVGGGYDGVYPFAIYMRQLQDSTNSRLDCSQVLNSIGSYVDELSEYPEIEDGEITDINWLTNATIVKRFANGVEDYMITFELLFEHE